MKRLAWLVLCSALIHGVLFLWILRFSVPLAPVEEQTMKTYIVSEQLQQAILAKIKQTDEILAQQIPPINVDPQSAINDEVENSTELKSKAAQQPKIPSIETQPSVEPSKHTEKAANTASFVKINPFKSLNSILANEHQQFVQQQQIDPTTALPKRITVPKLHQQNSPAIKLSDVGGKTDYQQGKNCYTIDLNGVMGKQDLPSGAPRPCKHVKSDDELLLEQSLNKWRKDK